MKMEQEKKDKINKNWIILYNILFYCGLIIVIEGFNIWWMAISGLMVMVFSRIEEERIKDINLGLRERE